MSYQIEDFEFDTLRRICEELYLEPGFLPSSAIAALDSFIFGKSNADIIAALLDEPAPGSYKALEQKNDNLKQEIVELRSELDDVRERLVEIRSLYHADLSNKDAEVSHLRAILGGLED